MKKVIDYFRYNYIYILIVLPAFIITYFLCSILYKNMVIPLLLPLICLLYTFLYFCLIYFVGIKTLSFFIKLVKFNSEEDIRSLIFIDLFIIGLFSLITIGLIGGLFGFLSWKYYLIVTLLLSIVPTNKSISLPNFKNINKTDALFSLGILLIFIFFLYNQLVQSMYAVDIVADIFVQTLQQIKDIIASEKLIPSILAKENRMHEYFYPILILIPAIGKDFFGSIASVSFGIQVLSVFVIYFGASRLYGRFNAILATIFITLLSLSMYLVYAGIVPLPKIYLRFFNIMYAISFVYIFLYIKFNNKIFLWLSVFSVAFLSGTTLVGLYFASGTYLAFLLLLYLKRISKKDLALFTIVIICFFIVVKIVNFLYSHSFLDLITILFLNMQNKTFMYPEFISNVDRFFMEYHWYGQGNKGNTVFLTTELMLKLLFDHAGIFVIISTLLIIIFFRKYTFSKIAIIYNLHMLVILYSSINVRSSHTTFIVLWHSFVFLNLIYWLPLVFEKVSIFKERKYLDKCVFIFAIIIFSSLYLSSEISFRGFIKNNYYYKQIIASSLNLEKKITASRFYLATEEFKNLKSKIKKNELVFNFADSYPYLFLSEYLEYTPIDFPSIINEALYYDDIARTIQILKRLKIRYIIVTKERGALPRPVLFEEQYAGKYLRIIGRNKVPSSVIKLYENEPTHRYMNKNDAGILLEILYSASATEDMEVIRLTKEIKFREDEILKKVLKASELNDEVLNRIVSYLIMTQRY